MKINSFRFHEEGLNRFFGPLEAKIMKLVWSFGAATIKDIQIKLEEDHPLSFNTVMTVMNRLVEKGILQKTTKGRQSLFSATESQEEFLKTQTREIAEGLLHEFEELTVTQFADLLDQVKPELLEKLEEKLNAVKQQKGRNNEA